MRRVEIKRTLNIYLGVCKGRYLEEQVHIKLGKYGKDPFVAKKARQSASKPASKPDSKPDSKPASQPKYMHTYIYIYYIYMHM